MERLICLAIGYAFGLFQTGYIYGKTKKLDIRNYGSGNSGTTNALRTLGVKAGVITLLGDCFKCVLAIVLVKILFANSHELPIDLLGMYAGAGAILGHNFPFYLKFRGGKGIAATAGILLATRVWMALIPLVVFILIVALTRYVSLGSILVSIIFAAQVIIYGQMGGFDATGNALIELDVLAVLLALMAIYKHKANIQRLLSGTENKISFGKKKTEE